MSDGRRDRYLIATTQYLTNRHDIALRLLAECDKEEYDHAMEDRLRDEALVATVGRNYPAAQQAMSQLVSMRARKDRSVQPRGPPWWNPHDVDVCTPAQVEAPTGRGAFGGYHWIEPLKAWLYEIPKSGSSTLAAFAGAAACRSEPTTY